MTPILPLELCVAILQILHNSSPDDFEKTRENQTVAYRSATEGLKNCSLASQAFRDIAQPLLFERMRLGNPHGRTPQYGRERADTIQELFYKRPEARNWVKILVLAVYPDFHEDFERPTTTPLYRDIIEPAIERLVLQMPNLRSVTISNTPLTKELYDHFYRSPKLSHFHGEMLKVSEGAVYASSDLPETRSPIKRFTVLNTSMSHPSNAELMTALARLGFTSSVTEMRLDSSIIKNALISKEMIPDGAFANLRSLDLFWIPVDSIGTLMEIFRRAVNLETLKYVFVGLNARMAPAIDLSLDSQHMPKLLVYDGDFFAARTFIRGRPVSTVRLNTDTLILAGFQLDQQILASGLSGGSVPIRVLELRLSCWIPETFNAIAEVLPELEELTVTFRPRGQHLERHPVFGTTNFGVMPKLELLTFVNMMSMETYTDETLKDDDEEERMLLVSTRRAWPNLRSARLRRDVEWKWTHDEGWAKV